MIEIIEFCKIDEQFLIEQYWIDRFFGKRCYNINKEATKPPNVKGRKKNLSKENRQ